MLLSEMSYVGSHIFTLQSKRRSPDGTITHCLSDFSVNTHKKFLIEEELVVLLL